MSKEITIEIPVIDIAPLLQHDTDAKETIQLIRRATETVGFFYIENYGLTSSDHQKYLQLAKTFFLSLSSEQKKKISRKEAVGSNGYVAIGTENLDEFQPQLTDIKEAMDVCVCDPHPLYQSNQWPDPEALPKWREEVEEFIEKMNRIGIALVKSFSLAMGENEDFLSQWYSNSSSLVRFLRYPPRKEEETYIGCGAHSDYGVLTMLLQDEVGGLQILYNGKWIDATPKKDTLVINVGDCMEYLTNGAFKATKHRVINKSTERDRYVTLMFFEPSVDMPVDCVAAFRSLEDKVGTGRPKYFGEHLKNRLTATYTV